MVKLTPNADVSYFETMAFDIGSAIYEKYLRDLIIEKINDPEHEWDDRVLAMMDGMFDHKTLCCQEKSASVPQKSASETRR